jgi:hypothetical protein
MKEFIIIAGRDKLNSLAAAVSYFSSLLPVRQSDSFHLQLIQLELTV